MRVQKDRYTHALVLFIVCLIISAYLFRNNQEKRAAGVLMAGSVFGGFLLALNMIKPARLHSAPEGTAIKPENDCGFVINNTYPAEIDGVKINEKRYKVVNGVDIYVDENGVHVCGPGSWIMQKIGNGGYEPKSIQNDKCWN